MPFVVNESKYIEKVKLIAKNIEEVTKNNPEKDNPQEYWEISKQYIIDKSRELEESSSKYYIDKNFAMKCI